MTSDTLAPRQNPSNSNNPSNWFRGFVQGKTRIVLAWIFAALLIFSAHRYPTWPGIVICFLGATVRYWASGYLRKDNRPAVGGPYAFVRNPLYFGTWLMAVGTALAIEAWVLLAAITVLFAIVYHYIILDEETKLQRIFGEPYLEYCRLVPRFFPRPWRASQERLLKVNPELEHHKFSKQLAAKNKAMEAYLSFIGLIGFVTLVAWVWQTLK
jgi:protein-S-isoprenylcysteine O-methyltransferase Ste14